jgi:c-di-GMP-binding flagellar brake protein YcgR
MSIEPDKDERRRSKRSSLSEKATCEVSSHLLLHKARGNQSTTIINSNIKNISEGGVCLMTKERLETSQIVKISLPLPHVKMSTPTLAEVRWVRKDPGKRLYRAGLRFLL